MKQLIPNNESSEIYTRYSYSEIQRLIRKAKIEQNYKWAYGILGVSFVLILAAMFL